MLSLLRCRREERLPRTPRPEVAAACTSGDLTGRPEDRRTITISPVSGGVRTNSGSSIVHAHTASVNVRPRHRRRLDWPLPHEPSVPTQRNVVVEGFEGCRSTHRLSRPTSAQTRQQCLWEPTRWIERISSSNAASGLCAKLPGSGRNAIVSTKLHRPFSGALHGAFVRTAGSARSKGGIAGRQSFCLQILPGSFYARHG